MPDEPECLKYVGTGLTKGNPVWSLCWPQSERGCNEINKRPGASRVVRQYEPFAQPNYDVASGLQNLKRQTRDQNLRETLCSSSYGRLALAVTRFTLICTTAIDCAITIRRFCLQWAV